uniref:Uncharacterized protein n=1 Tax=Tetraselmis sp. GSL018 TaxID=582737 RepID=A0A061S0U9_9CHLO
MVIFRSSCMLEWTHLRVAFADATRGYGDSSERCAPPAP